MQKSLVHVLVGAKLDRDFIQSRLSGQGLDIFAFDDVWEFLQFASGGNPACLILDIDLPGLNGLAVLARAHASGNFLPPTIMLGPNNINLATRAMKQGAADYLARPLSSVALIDAVLSCINPDATGAPRPVDFLAGLSKRERQVLAILVQGKTASYAASQLGVKTETINFHSKNLRKKAVVDTTPELVTKALQSGFQF